jgi:hypothetical protein
MSNIRWRLIMALLSFGATLALTAPAAVSHLSAPQIGQVADVIWPNGAIQSDVIWPNGATVGDVIWPNGAVLNDVSGN